MRKFVRSVGGLFIVQEMFVRTMLIVATADDEISNFPIGDPRRCLTGNAKNLLRFEVLPGGGWDNLQNKDMGIIANKNYSECRTTDDGKFLIPDGVFTIPVKSSNVEIFSELFEHWNNFTSTFSSSININAGVSLGPVSVSGSFSNEYEHVKSSQHFDKSLTTRVQARYVQYIAKKYPGSALDKAFSSRLRKIAAYLMLNRLDNARYESQLLVRDYGTHVVTSIDAGAALVQIDHLSKTFLENKDSTRHTITAAASASFFSIFSFGLKYSQTSSKTSIDGYMKSLTSSKVLTRGGPIFKPTNYSANDWTDSVLSELVAIDKSGEPVYDVITSSALPGVPEAIVNDVHKYVKEAVQTYYEHNTYRGCTQEDSPNFSYQANSDDGSCKATSTSFAFGGVYQTCTGLDKYCKGMSQKNPQTGDFSCPTGYEAIPLQHLEPQTICWTCWWRRHCRYADQAYYSTFWCAATGNLSANSGFLFGGLYTSKVNNLVTQSKNCPLNFFPLKVLSDLTVCVSDDYELGFKYSLPFAGFFGCKAGNPLALKSRAGLLQDKETKSMLAAFMKASGLNSYPKACPDGYSQHLAVIDFSCSIHYCIKAGALSSQGLPKIQRPPFMELPTDDSTDTYSIIPLNGTESRETNASVFLSTFLAENGMADPFTELTAADETASRKIFVEKGFPAWTIAVVTVSAGILCIVVIAVIYCRIKRHKRSVDVDPWAGASETRAINAGSERRYSRFHDSAAATTI